MKNAGGSIIYWKYFVLFFSMSFLCWLPEGALLIENFLRYKILDCLVAYGSTGVVGNTITRGAVVEEMFWVGTVKDRTKVTLMMAKQCEKSGSWKVFVHKPSILEKSLTDRGRSTVVQE